MAKLGFADRKTEPPKNIPGLIDLLAEIMSASLNNEIDLENGRLAINAATRIIEAIQADTRMKAVAAATGRALTQTSGFALIESEKPIGD